MTVKLKRIFSKQMANYLCQKGIQIVKTDIHNKKPWLYVYSFEDSPQLRQAMESYVPDETPGERGNRI